MELVVIDSSAKACAKHIIQHLQDKKLDNTKYTLQVMKTYNHYYPILNEFLSHVPNNLVIEYVNELSNIDIKLEVYTYTHTQIYKIVVINKELNINHSYTIRLVDLSLKIYNLYIKCINDIETCIINQYIQDGHHHLIDYYMKQYNPKKEQLTLKQCDHIDNHKQEYLPNHDDVISHIKDREQFNNELTVIIALFNSL